MPRNYLTLPEFRASAKWLDDLGEFTQDEAGNKGWVYADTCYIVQTGTGEIDNPAHFALIIERSGWDNDMVEPLEHILWATFYLGECGGDVMLSKDDGTLDCFVQGYCAAENIEVDGDLWGVVFSRVEREISYREARDLMDQNRDAVFDLDTGYTETVPVKPKPTIIWHAEYVSRHFHFDAYDVSEEAARNTLIDTMHSHAMQYKIPDPAWFSEDDIVVLERKLGTGYRDNEEIR